MPVPRAVRPAFRQEGRSPNRGPPSETILFSSVSYVTPLGRSLSYFRQWEDSELAPSAIRRMSVHRIKDRSLNAMVRIRHRQREQPLIRLGEQDREIVAAWFVVLLAVAAGLS